MISSPNGSTGPRSKKPDPQQSTFSSRSRERILRVQWRLSYNCTFSKMSGPDGMRIRKRTFHGRWCYTVATSSLLLTEQLKSPIRIEFSGLGGSHVLEDPFVADLFVKCMPSAPCYGPSLAYEDRKETDTMWATSIGRTAQTHEYHMLHEAAWPFGVFAWQRILCQWDQNVLPALEPGLLMTRACSLAAMGSKCPAHQREPHPGYQNALRLFMMTLQPAPLVHYVQHLLIPACPSPTGEAAPLDWTYTWK